MFTAFIRPAHRELLAGFILLALILPLVRFLAGSGSLWNSWASVGTVLLFAIMSTRLAAVRSLDVPLRTWFWGLTATAAIWSVILAIPATASAVYHQGNSPYYTWYDTFLFTSGPMDWIDTNGAPYVVEGAGMTGGTILLSLLVHFVAFLLSAGIGSLVGVVRINGGVIRTLLTIVVIAAGLTAFSLWLANQASSGDHLNQHFAAEILWAGIPTTIIIFTLTWWVGRRVEI